MRKIKRTEGLSIAISHAGADGEALTNVQINLPVDGSKYMEGVNIIECIKERLLPVLNTDAINQQLTQADLDLIRGYSEFGIFAPQTLPDSTPIPYLLSVDNAVLGVVSFIEGSNKPTYTP